MRGQDADVSHLLPGDVGEAEEVEGGSGGTGTGRRCAETHSDEDDLAAQRALAPDERAHARDVAFSFAPVRPGIASQARPFRLHRRHTSGRYDEGASGRRVELQRRC